MHYKYYIVLILMFGVIFGSCTQKSKENSDKKVVSVAQYEKTTPRVDTIAYKKKLRALANGDTSGLWPVKSRVYPLKGALLPFKRIVAYYGNLYSKRMGVLGQYPPKELWEKLDSEVHAWEKADPSTPVQPAIQYIVDVAQGTPLKDGTYCMRMPAQQIDSALTIARMGNAIVFLDVQVARSDLQREVPRLEKYLKMPQVNLAIDPEFSMKDGSVPGHKIGYMDASDINFCSKYLAKLVIAYHLPPKILVVHRFTQGMVKHYKDIILRPEVQIVMNMDGWGGPALKYSTYKRYIYREPVQFTGFKLFYVNDLKKPPHRMLTPPELMKLRPQPIYIQYQ
ncbi:hypothetical protein [Microbacter margulisiae]|uniref:Lipoprotein n=1 Tax=Microbacter margulisiae TaxID=1350067 RepID=A0A7W5H2K6_9PORP|nr:hypothetical protein [Microbacter margulisiae]MBB3187850.1 hypothetical protein [Microbacter margulisiae]